MLRVSALRRIIQGSKFNSVPNAALRLIFHLVHNHDAQMNSFCLQRRSAARDIEREFPDAMEPLSNLLGRDGLCEQLPRLNQILECTELAWERNIKRFRHEPVRYLLIAEAAPWTTTGIPRYFYESLKGAWVSRILKTFFGELRPDTDEEAWMQLANKGFLLVDTLPFALQYRTPVRRGADYLKLLQVSQAHFFEKLNNKNLTWADDTKIALAFKWNGRRMIEALRLRDNLPNGCQKLDEALIAVDGSGYTNTQKLRELWVLPDPDE
jgi:hypothetical protein